MIMADTVAQVRSIIDGIPELKGAGILVRQSDGRQTKLFPYRNSAHPSGLRTYVILDEAGALELAAWNQSRHRAQLVCELIGFGLAVFNLVVAVVLFPPAGALLAAGSILEGGLIIAACAATGASVVQGCISFYRVCNAINDPTQNAILDSELWYTRTAVVLDALSLAGISLPSSLKVTGELGWTEIFRALKVAGTKGGHKLKVWEKYLAQLSAEAKARLSKEVTEVLESNKLPEKVREEIMARIARATDLVGKDVKYLSAALWQTLARTWNKWAVFGTLGPGLGSGLSPTVSSSSGIVYITEQGQWASFLEKLATGKGTTRTDPSSGRPVFVDTETGQMLAVPDPFTGQPQLCYADVTGGGKPYELDMQAGTLKLNTVGGLLLHVVQEPF